MSGKLEGQHTRSLRAFVIAGISILLVLSFVPSRASSKVVCPASKAIFFPNGNEDEVSLQGSSEAISTQTVCAKNGTIKVPRFSRRGYIFAGWTSEPDATSVESITALSAGTTTWTPNADITRAFAQWKPVEYSVTYNLNGGTGSVTNTRSTYMSTIYVGATISNNVFSFTMPTKVGYKFEGWKANNTIYTNGSQINSPDADVVFTAEWTTS